MSHSPFDFNQISTGETPLARRRRGSNWGPLALGAAVLAICGGAWWYLRNLPEDKQPGPVAADVQQARRPLDEGVADALVKIPVLEDISDVTVDDERPAERRVRVKPDGAPGAIRFSLAPPAPPGAKIDPASGEFSWLPGRAKPGDYQVTVLRTRVGAMRPREPNLPCTC